MTMRKLLQFGRDIGGVAALEMALIAPLIAGMALVSYSIWQLASTKQDMRAALKVGASYYMNGGGDDTAARALILSSWERSPQDANATVSRACLCGAAAAASCNTACPDQTPPAVYITLSASASAPTGMASVPISSSNVVRVR